MRVNLSRDSVVSSDTFPSINFESLHEQASAYGEGTPPEDAVVEQPEVSTTSETPDAPAAEGTTPTTEDAVDVSQKTEAQLAKLADDQLVEIVVNGETVQMPWKEAKAGFSRHADYTRKAQALAREKQEFESQRPALIEAQKQRDAFIQVFENKDLLKQLLEQRYPDLIGAPAKNAAEAITSQAPSVDPDEIATVGQVQSYVQEARKLIAQEIAAAQQKLRQEIGSATREVETNLETAKLANQINNTVKEIFEADPLITKLIPNAEQLLRYNVQQMITEETTPAEVTELFRTVAAGWSEEIKAALAEHNKTAVVNKQKLVDNNIQPPGGSPVTPQPADIKDPKTGKVDWSKVTEMAMQYGGK